MLLRALNLEPGLATSLFNLADLYRWETVKTGGKIGDKNREKQWVGNRQNRRKQSEQEIEEKQETLGKTGDENSQNRGREKTGDSGKNRR